MALLWGVGWLPTKLALEVVPPVFFASVRSVLTAGLLMRPRGPPLRPERPGRVLAASLLITAGRFG